MALPPGISTAVVTVGVPVTFTGGLLKTNITITPSAFLVHTATGHPLVNMIEEATANDGVAVQFTLPHTDQAGFQDEAGNAYQNWYYTATIQYQSGKVTKPAFTKVFQLAVGQTTVDLDLLPSGSPAMPYTAPVATVTSVNGQNGAITVVESTDAGVAAFVQGSGPTATALNATYAPASGSPNYATRNNASGAFGAVVGALEDGQSAVIANLSDSTGNNTGEWMDLTAKGIGTRVPTCRVQMKTWDGTTEKLGPWEVLQAGSLGERHAVIPATLARTLFTRSADIVAPTGDLDIRIKVALDDWTPAGLATLAARYGAAGARSWSLSLAATGNRLQLDWSADGTAMLAAAPPPNLPVIADGATKWVRMTLDVDNGSGGYTVTSYLSDDGQTWTQVGQTVTTAGTTSVYGGGTQEYELGGRGVTAQLAPGKFYEVQIRNGIDGPVVNPQPIDSWTRRITSDTLSVDAFGGSPTLYVYNGAHPGADLIYLTDATRLPKLFPPAPSALMFLSCSHNDREYVGTELLSRWDTALTALRARIGNTAAFCVITQNPQIPPIELSLRRNHERRRRERLVWAARNGLYSIDTYKAFLDDPRGVAALLQTDGIHPTLDAANPAAQTGSRLWADTVLQAFDAGI